MSAPDDPLDRFLSNGDVLHVAADGQMLPLSTGRCPPPRLLMPGSFNRLVGGLWELAEVAPQMIGGRVAVELCVVNVDKPRLRGDEIRRRLGLSTLTTLSSKATGTPII